jgi:gamma-glutamyltranspeptidase
VTPTRWPEARAHRGMVATPHVLASAAGVRALERGGNALDAALAAASTIAVVYPHVNGVGGDNVWLIDRIFGEGKERPRGDHPPAQTRLRRRATLFA